MADLRRKFVVLVVVLLGWAATPAWSDDAFLPDHDAPAPAAVTKQDWAQLDTLWQPSQAISGMGYTTPAPNMAQAPQLLLPVAAASGPPQFATANGQALASIPPVPPMIQSAVQPMLQPGMQPPMQQPMQPGMQPIMPPMQAVVQPFFQPMPPPAMPPPTQPPVQPMMPAMQPTLQPRAQPMPQSSSRLMGGDVCGRLLNQGRPLVNCHVVIVPLRDVDGVIGADEDRKPLATVTDENGVFHFEDVPEGGYKLTWLPDGQRQWIRRIAMRPDVHVRNGEVTTLKEIRIALQTIN